MYHVERKIEIRVYPRVYLYIAQKIHPDQSESLSIYYYNYNYIKRYIYKYNSEVHPVPTARRPLNRLSVCPFVAFRLNSPSFLGPSTSFGFSKT